MKINGTNRANKQIGQMGMNQATDSYSRDIQNQIANAQKQETAKKQAASGKETSETVDAQKNSKVENGKMKSSTEAYAKELAKLAPSVEFGVGSALSSAKSGKTLTINPKLLEKTQNNPAQEKETKELIKGVESAMNLIGSINKANGWTVVYKHSYIDETVGYYRNDFMLNMSDKLREEGRKNSEKLIEKSKEKATEKREELQDPLEENKTETMDKKIDGEQEKSEIIVIKENTALERAEQMF